MAESVTTTTTEWKSAFSYDNVDRSYSELFVYSNNIVFKSDGQYYAVSSSQPFGFDSFGSFIPSVNNTAHIYNASSGIWEKVVLDIPAYFSDYQIIAQDMVTASETYFSTADLRSGHGTFPHGTYFDGIYVDSALSEVVACLPCLSVAVSFLAIRKGIQFLLSFLKGG